MNVRHEITRLPAENRNASVNLDLIEDLLLVRLQKYRTNQNYTMGVKLTKKLWYSKENPKNKESNYKMGGYIVKVDIQPGINNWEIYIPIRVSLSSRNTHTHTRIIGEIFKIT